MSIAVLLVASAAAQEPASRPADGEPRAVCQITDPRLNEASGLIAGRLNPDIYYTHNDSQGQPHVLAIDRDGRIVAEIRLRGATNYDWEDIALAPGSKPGKFDICVADIGDNLEKRTEVVIYRFPEPDLRSETDQTRDVDCGKYSWIYPDGPHNAEGFVVHPRTGDGYIFTKRADGRSDVYRLPQPWSVEKPNRAQLIGPLQVPAAPGIQTVVTAADLSPEGSDLVTRAYLGGWRWHLSEKNGTDEFVRIFKTEPTRLSLPAEPQGEALCFSADGTFLLTISEGTPTTLYEIKLPAPASSPSP